MLKSIDLEGPSDFIKESNIENNHTPINDIGNKPHFKTLQLKEKVGFIIKKMDIFTRINIGDKIGKHNGVYYLVEKGGLQKIKRWWYSENRNNTFDYLDTEFTSFFKLCNEFGEYSILQNKIIIKNEFIKLIDSLVSGVYNLKLTYHGDIKDKGICYDINDVNNFDVGKIGDDSTKKLICKIDSIILTLIDLKDKILKDINNSYPMEIRKQINHRLNKELNKVVNIKFSFP